MDQPLRRVSSSERQQQEQHIQYSSLSSWPHRRDDTREILGLSSSQTHSLPLDNSLSTRPPHTWLVWASQWHYSLAKATLMHKALPLNALLSSILTRCTCWLAKIPGSLLSIRHEKHHLQDPQLTSLCTNEQPPHHPHSHKAQHNSGKCTAEQPGPLELAHIALIEFNQPQVANMYTRSLSTPTTLQHSHNNRRRPSKWLDNGVCTWWPT